MNVLTIVAEVNHTVGILSMYFAHAQVMSLLSMGLYPNVCWHKEKRKVLTYDHKAALVHKSSVNCDSRPISFPSPFFVFGEKVRVRPEKHENCRCKASM